MPRCPSCMYPLPENRERVGARCPSCRDPLYEPPDRFPRTARAGDAACATHPKNESVGTCGRCGNYLCEFCRTRWRDQVLCAACVERALGSEEATPEQARTTFRQALTGLLLGVGAWLIALLGMLPLIFTAASGETSQAVIVLFALGILGAGVAAVFGLGLSATVLRARGGQMIMATIGLMVSGLYLGALIGNFVLGVWQM